MIGNNRLGASAYVDAKPAIVSKSQRNSAWHQARLKYDMESIETDTGEFEKHLAEWKESQTWKQEYSSWTEACEKGIGMTRRWANKLIERVQPPSLEPSKESTNDGSGSEMPQKPNESQETPGTTVPTQRPQKSSKPKQEPCQPTNGEAEELTEKPPTDASGCVIPQKLIALRNRRQEITDLEHKASVLHALFVKLQTDHDPIFNHLVATGQVQTFAAGAGSMRYALAECSPDVVCPQCNGSAGKCHICHGTGWISQVRWNRDWVKSHDTTKAAVVRQRNGANP